MAAAAGAARIQQHQLTRRDFPEFGVSVIAKPGSLVTHEDKDLGRYIVWTGEGEDGDDVVLMAVPRDVMEDMHESYAENGEPAVPQHVAREEHVWFTAVREGADTVFVFSQQLDNKKWLTLLYYDGRANDRLNALIAMRSIAFEMGLAVGLDRGSDLAKAVAQLSFPSAGEDSGTPNAMSIGTAFFVSPFHALTAAHVAEDCRRLVDETGRAFNIVGADRSSDLAILQASAPSAYWLRLAPHDDLRLGDHVRTLGFPSYFTVGRTMKFSAGHVAALAGFNDRETEITITTPVNPGNSGGPLLDSSDAVAGVVTSRFGRRDSPEGPFMPDQNLNAGASWRAMMKIIWETGIAYEPRREAKARESRIDESLTGAVIPLLCVD